MRLAGGLAVIFVVLSLAACGGDSQTYEVPSKSMEPTISAGEQVTVDLGAYDDAAPAVGDIVALHPPAGMGRPIECGVQHPLTQACPKPTRGLSSETFIKRIVAGPGDELSIHNGQPVLNGKPALGDEIQTCRESACNLPKPITIPAGEYFVLGDNPPASNDSRYWGPVPRAGILGEMEG